MSFRATGADLARRSAGVDAVLQNVADEVAHLPRAALFQIAPALADARRELEKDMRSFLAKVKDPDEKFTMQQYRNALVQIRGTIDEISKLEPRLATILNKGMDTAGALSVKHVQYELAAFSKLFEQSIQPIPLIPVSAVSVHHKTMIGRNKASAKRYAGQVGIDLRRQIAIGMIRGETTRQMVKRLVGPGSQLKLGKIDILPQAAGLIAERQFRKYQYWAERIVRTEVINSYNQAADDAIEYVAKIDDRIQRKWDAANDYRACPDCAALDQEVTGVDGTFTGGVSSPPLHPNCRCSVVAWRSDWDEQGKITRPDSPAAPAPQPPVPELVEPAPMQEAALTVEPPPTLAPPIESFDKVDYAKGLLDAFYEEPSAAPLTKDSFAYWSGAPGVNMPSVKAQGEIRDGLRDLLKRYKMVSRDTGMLPLNSSQVFPTRGAKEYLVGADQHFSKAFPGASAYHVHGQGTVVVREEVWRKSKKFLTEVATKRYISPDNAQFFQANVHEAVHGHSPISPDGVRQIGKNSGLVLEEATTEAAARFIMRDAFGLDGPEYNFKLPLSAEEVRINQSKALAYDRFIYDALKIFSEHTQLSIEATAERFEQAAIKMRGGVIEADALTRGGFVAKLVDNFDLDNIPSTTSHMKLRKTLITQLGTLKP